MLGAAIKQLIHHRPGIGSKRLTGTDFLEMEKILVMNGISLRKFTFELMTCIYHFKNIVCWALLGCFLFFFFQTGLLEDHSDMKKKCQSNTLACLYVIAMAVAPPHRLSHFNISRRVGTENGLHELNERYNLTVCIMLCPSLFMNGALVHTQMNNMLVNAA